MSRRLLLGRAGTGKTYACLDRIAVALRERREALLLVPTYSQAEHLCTALLERGGGLRAPVVQTFTSFAERQTGVRLRRLAPAPVRDRVAASVLEATFPEAAGQAGFRAEFLAAVKEIKEQGLAPDDALERARAHFPEGSRGLRLFEAYVAYCGALQESDHEDLLLRTRDALRHDAPALDLFLVDGFHDFTVVQREIVELLAGAARETTVTLPFDPDDTAHPIFTTAARTAHDFAGYERVPLRGNRRATEALGRWEQRLFTEPGAPAAADGVRLLAAASEEDEADRLARLVAGSPRPFRDFLVVRRSFQGLHAVYRAAFGRHGVPLRFFGAEPLGHTPAARAATLFLRHLRGELDPVESLLLFRSPYLLDRPEPERVDALAERLRRHGRYDGADLLPLQLDDPLPRLLARHLGLRDALAREPDGDDAMARAALVLRLLAAEAEVVAELPAAEAAEQVLRRIPLLHGQQGDRRHDCVYAVEARDARQWEKPVVLVAGLTAASYPHPVRQDLFLRDDDRRRFGEERGLFLPLRSRREEEERYLFYVVLTRAREEVVLSHAAFDEEGGAVPPSPYLAEAVAHLAEPARRDVALAEQVPAPDEILAPRDLLPVLADGLARADLGEGALAAALYDREAIPRTVLAAPSRLALLRASNVRPPKDPARKLSASSINDYLRCPFLFFARKVLKVSPEREHCLDPLRRGTIVHNALEECARQPLLHPRAVFDEVFAAHTETLRLGLVDDAHRRWMRRAVEEAAEAMRRHHLDEVESDFRFDLDDVTLRGRIDRIDRFPEGKIVRDYKTGTADIRRALAFEDIQLDLYLLAIDNPLGAVYERLRKGDRVGFVRKGMKERVGGKGITELDEEQMAARAERTRHEIATMAANARAGRLAVHPRDPERCTRQQCDAYDLCRVHRTRWLSRGAQ